LWFTGRILILSFYTYYRANAISKVLSTFLRKQDTLSIYYTLLYDGVRTLTTMNPKPFTEKELVQQLRAGNEQAVRQLYNDAFTYCASFVTKNNGTPEDARGLFQDVLIVLYKKLDNPDFAINSSLKTYLYAITKNLWFTHLRKTKKTGLHLVVDEEDTPLEFSEDGSELKAKQEQEEQLLELEEHLRNHSEECQQLLRLFFYEKKNYREVAALMDYSESYVRKKKMKCIQTMREKFFTTKGKNHDG